MAERRFLLVDAEVLPDVFLKVLQAKELLPPALLPTFLRRRAGRAFPAARSINTRTMSLMPNPAARP